MTTKIEVLADECVSVESERDPDEEFSGEDTHTDWSFEGIKIVTGKNHYSDLTVSFEPKPDTIYYLVVVVYHDGDSFSHRENGNVEYVDLYRDFNAAEETAKEIRRHDDAHSRWTDESPYDLVLTLDNGKAMKYCASWQAFFCGIGSIRVIPVRLGHKHSY